MAFLAHNLAQQGSGLFDRVMMCAPTCLPPSLNESNEATAKLRNLNYEPDFCVAISEIYKGHIASTEEPIKYTFSQDAQNILNDLHDEFNATLREAISSGSVPPASKQVELIQRLSLAIFVLENTLQSVVQDSQFQFPRIIPQEAVRKASKYVTYCENQKETLLKVIFFFYSLSFHL